MSTRVVTNRGLRSRHHKYLADPVEVASEAPAGYTIEDGVLIDGTEAAERHPNARKAYDEWTRYWPRSSEEYRAEEAAWAAKSGPCVIIKQGRQIA